MTTATAPAAFHQILRPTPSPLGSGRNTPVSVQSSGGVGSKLPHQSQKPAHDHFSNLVDFGIATKSTANLSLREQQQRLEAERRQKAEEKQKQLSAQYGNGQFWDSLSQKPSANNSRSVSPDAPGLGSLAPARKGESHDEDLFAAFKAETKVDKSSYYPPPPPSSSGPPSGKVTPALDLGNPSAWTQPALSGVGGFNDDDPFNLRSMKPTAQAPASQPALTINDDDVLGDLGKPVDEVKKMQVTQQTARQLEPGKPIEDDSSDSSDNKDINVDNLDPFEKAVSQLVDLGFTPENARRGIAGCGAGLNVHAAAGWLLDDAERQAKEKAKGRPAQKSDRSRQDGRRSQGGAGAAWMQDGEGDLSKTAATVGATFLKSANSLWKTGQKKMQQAVADFQQDPAELNQPKWMRSTQQSARPIMAPRKSSGEVTDEALMLESGARPGRRPGREPGGNAGPYPPPSRSHRATASSREQSSFASEPAQWGSPASKWKEGSQALGPRLDAKARLSKLAQDDDGAHAYVSPARRSKKVSSYSQQQPAQLPNPPPGKPESEPEPDLLNTAAQPPVLRPKPTPRRLGQPSPSRLPSQPKKPCNTTPVPTIPPRQIPLISPAALRNSLKHRADGTAYFKRGDYAAAHVCYSNSLSTVPQTHPLAILILTNRSLTALKKGEPRQAIDDATNALRIIGPSGGVDETITVENEEKKDMRELYGKALSRKAEALEQLEKWSEAASAWQQCVESGLGGATAIAGKQRCQKALAPKPAAAPRPKPMVAKPRSKPRSAVDDLVPAKDSAAVERLRAANRAAEAADDEKFALADKVDARISAWRDGKRDNLRALLGSLDKVLWEGSGWKAVGMHELVMVNRVKIVYVKAIAKCHPDKVGRLFLSLFFRLFSFPHRCTFSLTPQARRRFCFPPHYIAGGPTADIVLILAAPRCQYGGQAHRRDCFCDAK